ncbi:MAG: hypothetical protein GX844_08265 [Alcaligenaceae bacterium]|nr:hypothetical protein [Alcaligenaceae bacterium]
MLGGELVAIDFQGLAFTRSVLFSEAIELLQEIAEDWDTSVGVLNAIDEFLGKVKKCEHDALTAAPRLV